MKFCIIQIGMALLLFGVFPMPSDASGTAVGLTTAEKPLSASAETNLLLGQLMSGQVFETSPVNLRINEQSGGARPVYSKASIWADVLAYGVRPKRQKYFLFRPPTNPNRDAVEIVFFDDKLDGFFLSVPNETILESTADDLIFFRTSTFAGDGISGEGKRRFSVSSKSFGSRITGLSASITFESNSKDVFRPFRSEKSIWRAEMQFAAAEVPESLLVAARAISMNLKKYNELEEARLLRERIK